MRPKFAHGSTETTADRAGSSKTDRLYDCGVACSFSARRSRRSPRQTRTILTENGSRFPHFRIRMRSPADKINLVGLLDATAVPCHVLGFHLAVPRYFTWDHAIQILEEVRRPERVARIVLQIESFTEPVVIIAKPGFDPVAFEHLDREGPLASNKSEHQLIRLHIGKEEDVELLVITVERESASADAAYVHRLMEQAQPVQLDLGHHYSSKPSDGATIYDLAAAPFSPQDDTHGEPAELS